MTDQETAPACVMLVDDEPFNLELLEKMLRRAHYEVVAFSRGSLALEAAKTAKPDIVLLDVSMPEMNGHEVCRRMKSNPELKDIPIVFLSGNTDIQNKALAFESGAVDYITKPFNRREVLLRVRTHLATRCHTQHLDELVQQRSEELSAAQRRLHIWNEAKTHWINMLAHELRTPLTGVICTTNVLLKKVPLDNELSDMRQDVDVSFRRLRKLIDDAVALAEIDGQDATYKPDRVSVSILLEEACKEAKQCATDVEYRLCEKLDEHVRAYASGELLRRAFADLLVTAGCCTPSGGTVEVCGHVKSDRIVIDIITPGDGLPDDDLDTFFEVGEQRTLLKGGADFGLGPALAKRILSLFKGDVEVRNGAQAGIVISVFLPVT